MVEAFIQVHVVIGYFVMTCLTACCHSVTSSAVQLLQGWKRDPFYLSKDAAISVYVTLSNRVWMHPYMRFQDSMSH